MDKRRQVPKHVQESHPDKKLWRKPWKKTKTGAKGHRAPHPHDNPQDQTGPSTYYEDEIWHQHRLNLLNQLPSLSCAAKAAFSTGTAIVSVPAAEILELLKPTTSSSTSLCQRQSALSPRRSETRLKTLEEEAVSAALAAAAATAAAAAERARIAAQAALAIQAEQEMEAANAMEEARLARELAAQQEKEDKKLSHQSEFGSLLLSKRRRVPKNRAPRTGSVSQQQPNSPEPSKKEQTAPIHSRPPPPMVSPRFAARLVELVSTAGPVPVPQYPGSKPVQSKRASLTRNTTKGVHTLSPPATDSNTGSQLSSNRSQASAPAASRTHRPNTAHNLPQQPPTPVRHSSPPSAPNSQTNPSPVQAPHQYNPSGGHQSASRTSSSQQPTPASNHPPTSHAPPLAPHSPQPPPQTSASQQPTTNSARSQQAHQSQPQSQQSPTSHPRQSTNPPSAPPPASQPNPPANRPTKSPAPSPYSSPPASNQMPPYEKPTNDPQQTAQCSYGMAPSNNPEPPTYQQATNQPQPLNQSETLNQPQPTRVAFSSNSNQSYQPPASHLYGTLPRKNQSQPNAQAQNVSTTLEFTSPATSVPHVTLAMLPNTASNQNHLAQHQLPEAAPSAKPRNPNQRPSSATRASVGALLRSGIRSLNRNSVSAAALDRPKQTETSVAWNTTKIAAPADDSATGFAGTILPPCDLSENDSALYQPTSSQPAIPWSTAWQSPGALPVFTETRPNLEREQKQGLNSWQQDSYFPLDVGPTITTGHISQTIFEVNQSSSLNSLPQPYMPIDTMASHRTESWWPKGSVDPKSSVHWNKNVSSAQPPNRSNVPLQQQPLPPPLSPPQQTNNTPPTWPSSAQSQAMPWQNQPCFEDRGRKRSEVAGGLNPTLENSVKTNFQEQSLYQPAFFQAYENGSFQQPLFPPQQQHYPETLLEEASVSEEPQ